jgi:branched-chain amino acid transport system ATP-binding protein
MNAMEIRGLKVHFGGIKAVDGVDWSIPARGVHALIGPNGAGKTSLVNAITGFYRPTHGAICSAGQDVTANAPQALCALGITRTFQNLQVFWTMSVLDNVMAGFQPARQAGFLRSLLRPPTLVRAEVALAGEAMDLLAAVGLTGRAADMASSLSYGELKRLEIARALAGHPRLLFLDEPVAGCTSTEKKTLGEVIRRAANQSGAAIVLIEHDMRLVMEISDSVNVLVRGTLLAQGTPKEIKTNQIVIDAYLGATEDFEERVNDADR